MKIVFTAGDFEVVKAKYGDGYNIHIWDNENWSGGSLSNLNRDQLTKIKERIDAALNSNS